jgi:hypothetical protein
MYGAVRSILVGASTDLAAPRATPTENDTKATATIS